MLLFCPQQIPFWVIYCAEAVCSLAVWARREAEVPTLQVYLALLSYSKGLAAWGQGPHSLSVPRNFDRVEVAVKKLFPLFFLPLPSFSCVLLVSMKNNPLMWPRCSSWVCGAESTAVSGTLKAGLYETSHLKIFLSLLRLFTFAK